MDLNTCFGIYVDLNFTTNTDTTSVVDATTSMAHTKDDLVSAALKQLRVEHVQSLTEIAQLKAKLYDAENEISDLRLELKETRAMLGETIVTVRKQKVVSEPNAIPILSERYQTAQKRPRSLSVEVIGEPTRKKADNTPEMQRPVPQLSHFPHSKAYVSAPAISNNDKSHQRIYPTPTPSFYNKSKDGKRYRVESGDSETEAHYHSVSSRKSSTATSGSSVSSKKKIKSKHEVQVRVSQSVTEAYLSSSLPLPISPPPHLDLQVPRTFLRLAYGGSDQQFIQCIKDTHNPSGPSERRLIFPTVDMNPALPSRPGHAGLVFARHIISCAEKPLTVFYKPPETKKSLWLYLGEYTGVLCKKMMAIEEFRIQKDVVKLDWAIFLLRSRRLPYLSMRSRIALRKAGVLPLEPEDVNETERLVQAEIDNVRANMGIDVAEEDIIAALTRGDEHIDIIHLTCVKYDHVFANDMKAKYANYDTMLAAANKYKKQSGVPGGNDDEDEDEDDYDVTRTVGSRGKAKEKLQYYDDSGDDYEP